MALYEGLKDVAKILQEAGKIDLYKEILEVREKLLEMQLHIKELEEENRDLKSVHQLGEELKFDRNSYWQGTDGPFCSNCWDSNRKKIRTLPSGNPAYHHCPTCKTSTLVFPEKDPPLRTTSYYDDNR